MAGVTTTYLRVELQGVQAVTSDASKLRGALESAGKGIESSNRTLAASVSEALGGVGTFMRGLGGLVGNKALASGINDIVKNVNSGITEVKTGINDAVETIDNVFTKLERILLGRSLTKGFLFLRSHSDQVQAAFSRALPMVQNLAGSLGGYGQGLIALGGQSAATLPALSQGWQTVGNSLAVAKKEIAAVPALAQGWQGLAVAVGNTKGQLLAIKTATGQTVAGLKNMTATSAAAKTSFAAFSAGSAAAPAIFGAIKAAAAGAAGGIVGVAKALAAAAIAAAKTPLGQLTLVLGAVTAAGAYYVKTIKEEMQVYQDLNPEQETAIRAWQRMGTEAEAAGKATMAVWGQADNEQFKQYIIDIGGAWTTLKTNVQQVLALLFSSDSVWPKIKADALAAISVIMGTISTALESVWPKSMQKMLGINTQFWVDMAESAKKEADDYFASTQTGQRWAEQYKRALASLNDKQKETADGAKEIANNITGIKEAAEATLLEMDTIDFGDVDIQGELDADAARARQQRVADAIYGVQKELEDKLAALSLMRGDDPASLEAKEALRLEIIQAAADKEKEIRMAAAQEIGDQRYIIEQQYQAQLAANAEAQKQAWAGVSEYIRGNAADSLQSLASVGMDLFDNLIEGGQDWRQIMYEGFKSLGKNLVSVGIQDIITTALSNQAKAANSQYGIPYIGPILAVAAGAAALASTLALKNKIKEPAISYANGGYISAGLVRGGSFGRDSVAAELMPGERVLSRREAEEYDQRGSQANSQVININVNVSGQLSTPAQVRETVRQQLIPAIRSAVAAGYSLS